MVKTKVDCEELQEDLHEPGEWAIVLPLKFSIGKVRHIGTKIPTSSIDWGLNFYETEVGKDLGVMGASSMKCQPRVLQQ